MFWNKKKEQYQKIVMPYKAETHMFRAIQEHEMTDILGECLCF